MHPKPVRVLGGYGTATSAIKAPSSMTDLGRSRMVDAQANTVAEFRGWTQFIGLQIGYSLMERTVERELIRVARALKLGSTTLVSLGAWGSNREISGRRQGRGREDDQ